MSETRGTELALPAHAPAEVPALELDLGGVPVRLSPLVIADLLAGPLLAPTRELTRKERAMRAGVKGVFMLALDMIDGDIAKGRVTGIERPVCPKGVDYLQFAMGYMARLAGLLYEGKRYALDYEVSEDGAITVTGVGAPVARQHAAPAATAPAQLVPADLIDDEDGAGANAGDTADRSEPVGSLVHPGRDGIGQDAVCETPDPAVADAVSVRQPVRAGLERS